MVGLLNTKKRFVFFATIMPKYWLIQPFLILNPFETGYSETPPIDNVLPIFIRAFSMPAD